MATVAENDKTVFNCKMAIIETVNVLIKSDRLDPYFLFGYQLRKLDDKHDTYTKAFLETKSESLNEEVLKKIVISNFYNEKNANQPM